MNQDPSRASSSNSRSALLLPTQRAPNLWPSLVVALCGIAAIQPGCSVGPDFKGAPDQKLNAGFSALSGSDVTQANAAILPSAVTSLTPGGVAQWWKQLNDPLLDSLIQRAIRGNLDLRLSRARIREARALRGVEKSALFPTIDANGRATRERRSENINDGVGSPSDSNSLFDAGLDASWEVDVFGGIRRAVAAADADLAAAFEDERDITVTLVSEVARNYVDLRGFQQRIDLNNQTVKAQQETLDLTKSLARAGISSDLQVQQSASILASRQSQLPPLYVGQRAAAYRLAVLLGEQPGALLTELATPAPIPASPKAIPIGLPSDLLRRRPDIRRSERRIAAATARVGVATADLFPRFSITGSFGLQSEQSNTFFDMNSRYWNVGPSVRWNVFDGKKIRSQINAANAREEAAVTEYERSILLALEDVENSLTSFIQEQARWRSLFEASDASQRALALATERYRSGIGDFLNVLDAQRELYELQDQQVQSDISVTRSLISVYKSLGGGWDEQPVSTEAAPGTPLVPDAPTEAVAPTERQ